MSGPGPGSKYNVRIWVTVGPGLHDSNQRLRKTFLDFSGNFFLP
jgi:hypothetical protein